MQQFREVSRTRTIYSTETHTSDFILNTFWNGKPVQFFEERCWVVVTGCQENKSCSKVLNFLERLDDRIRCTHEETVAIVKPWKDIGSTKSLGWSAHLFMNCMVREIVRRQPSLKCAVNESGHRQCSEWTCCLSVYLFFLWSGESVSTIQRGNTCGILLGSYLGSRLQWSCLLRDFPCHIWLGLNL